MTARRKPTTRDPAYVFTKPATDRIVRAVLAVERSRGGEGGGGHWPYRGDDGGAAEIKLCRTRDRWVKGDWSELDVEEPATEPDASGGKADPPPDPPPEPETLRAMNVLADIGAGRAVLVGRVGESWYLLAAEMSSMEIVTDVVCNEDGTLEVTKDSAWVIPYDDEPAPDPGPDPAPDPNPPAP